ncbi:hypothetical protein PRCB_26440 [Pantoea rodasii]|uniref:Uncharacterized protein n=1 Tax=Pantoea rodasii TaxID=1076549 RepID=A0A2M9W558_9GAMM|nr:hypothetical protein PRCB_26440 [Pantoea rodasii]
MVEARAPLLLQGLSAALRLLRWARTALPERSVGTTWKTKAPRQRREDGPAAAEALGPALRNAHQNEKKLPLLTVTAFANIALTNKLYAINSAATGQCLSV